MGFGSNAANLYGLGDDAEDLLFAHDAPLSGQFAKQWKLRVMAQGVALKEIAKAALRRLLAYKKSSSYTDLEVGESVLFYKASDRESARVARPSPDSGL